ncbi:alanine dehydrogenase [Georgenia faecalis]|uniref:alanine dehydrogenase n=1 Tax=Georgenia faecalis TaxID=2483799 RepID=UPI000FDC2F75|nr:alanine dehydrogenase [Georgenia faecalis]
MHVGVPRERKSQENRVALVPSGARELVARGHDVVVERGAGLGSGVPDQAYAAAGARLGTADDAWGAELVLKVKEPQPQELHHLRAGQVLFTYFHLAAAGELTAALVAAGTTAVAYEMVELPDGSLPLLAPMSEIAGRLSVQVGAYHLMEPMGGRGVLLAGVPGVRSADVVVLGAGRAGANAARLALQWGARVTVLDLAVDRLRELDELYGGGLRTIVSSAAAIEDAVREADLVVGAVLVRGRRAPVLVPHSLVEEMRPGSVLVDIAIDQGGCFADSRPTTHGDPTYRVASSLFYCVANMPGAVPATATAALTNATLPYALALAEHGWRGACERDPALAAAVLTSDGAVTSPVIAREFPDLPVAR